MKKNSSFKMVEGGVCAPLGFSANAISCGIKNPEATRLDMALIYSAEPTVSAGVFTTNRVKAACVKVTQAHQKRSNLRAVVANSGNANACTGVAGVDVARRECKVLAKELGLRASEVGVCSTGVIGLPMPMARIEPRLPELAAGLGFGTEKGADVARAIMTSDTVPKEASLEVTIAGKPVKIGICCKGAGMISPCMATMLCFVTTDVKMTRAQLEKCTHEAVERSFNRVTIDGDMSTNDTVLVMANGASGVKPESKEDMKLFCDALSTAMLLMAKRIVQDGERVTKFVEVAVRGARTYSEAKQAAEAVAKSFLVKSSWNGNDPNWGRIVHAVGYSGARIREELLDVDIAGLPACRGGLQADTPVDQLREAVTGREFSIGINLNQGKAEYTVYTTDISPEYVDFNRSEYAYWNQAKADGLTK